ncbi:MAG: hypothetical protein WDM96_19715 [Lacunisphaera sp.]
MKSLSLFLLGTVFLLTGCESSLKERIADAPPKIQEFEGSTERVNFAAQRAFKRLDFEIISKAMGRIDAASSIHHSEAFGNARQITARVRIHEGAPGKCEVEMWLTEEVAGDRFGGTYRKPLPEHDFYSLYFATLQQLVQEDYSGAEAEKK